MATLTGNKHWSDALNWSSSKNTRDVKDGPVIFGHHFPRVEAISTSIEPDRGYTRLVR